MQLAIFLLLIVLAHVGLYKMFEKAGEAGWKALVPIYNKIVWSDLIGRERWRVALLFVPIVNIFVYVGMVIDLVKSFDKHGFVDHILSVVGLPFYFLYLGFSKDEKYLGKGYAIEKENPRPKSVWREWSEAIIFAVFAATFIRMFLIEAYTIPTPSMEGSLLVGDFLFVSKVNYGVRTPMTPAQFPLVHNTVPLIGNESYSEMIKWPYKRLFGGVDAIDRFDPVVFNYPEGDTVVFAKMAVLNRGTTDYYTNKRMFSNEASLKDGRNYDMVVRPIDKRDNYIKRCVGLPGDVIEVKNTKLYVNGEKAAEPENIQYHYQVNFKTNVNPMLMEKWGILRNQRHNGPNHFDLTYSQVEKLKLLKNEVESVVLQHDAPSNWKINVFPHDKINYNWNMDYFGPVTVPKKGMTVNLTTENLAEFRRAISVYEGNTVKVEDGKILINGTESDSYTFKMDYFFMMGDNRHNSQDSRVWGFVPEDHIVGKPLFIWFSYDAAPGGGIRWDRIFQGATDM